MANELRFALRCQGSTKPIRKKDRPCNATTGLDDGRFHPLGSYTSYGFVTKDAIN